MTVPEPQGAATAYTPVLTDFLRVARVLFAPTAVFEEQREKPTVWMPWLVISVFLLAIAIFMRPYTMRMMELAAAARGTPMPTGAASVSSVIAIIASPLGFLILGLISAGVMWLSLMATGGEVRFKGLLSAAIFSLPAAVIQVLAQSVVLALRGGPDAVSTAADMRVALGLDLLLPADSGLSPFLTAILGGIGPLQIWALVITAIGVATLERTSKGAAWAAASAAYVVLLVVTAFFAGMSGMAA